MRGLEEGDGKNGASGKNSSSNGGKNKKKNNVNASNKKQFLIMTDIQNACIPHALKGRDILGAARTGRLVYSMCFVFRCCLLCLCILACSIVIRIYLQNTCN